MLAAIAGLMMLVGATSTILRVIGAASAVAAGLVPATTDVVASTVLIVALPLPLMLFSMVGRWASRLAIALCGSLFILAVLSTALLGSRDWSVVDGPAATKIRDVLTYDRLELWHEAEQLMTQNPLRGIGPGRFGDVAPLSQVDPSNLLFWAQNDFLQQGAEQGVPGLLALVGLFVCGFVALWANPNADAFVALAAVALAAVGIQACEDYVLHFPAVVLATAALVGAGIAPHGDPPSLDERGTGVPA